LGGVSVGSAQLPELSICQKFAVLEFVKPCIEVKEESIMRVSKLIIAGLVVLPLSAGAAFAETDKVAPEDNAIKLDHASVKQGKIKFQVVND